MNTKALVGKLSERLAEVNVQTLDTLLSEIKAVLIDTLTKTLKEV